MPRRRVRAAQGHLSGGERQTGAASPQPRRGGGGPRQHCTWPRHQVAHHRIDPRGTNAQEPCQYSLRSARRGAGGPPYRHCAGHPPPRPSTSVQPPEPTDAADARATGYTAEAWSSRGAVLLLASGVHGGLRCASAARSVASVCVTCTPAPYRRRAAATRRSRSKGRVAAFSRLSLAFA